MKTRLLLAASLLAFFTAGCGQKDSSSSNANASSAPTPSGPRTVELTAGDTMKFNVVQIDAKAGEQLTVILTNIGSQPKEVMGHNWILLKPDADLEAYDKAAGAAKAADYFPADLASQVITHIPLLGPRKSGETTFTVPTTPGDYPFLCSFPGHYASGMKGVLKVR